MSKLIAIATATGHKAWISPEHVVKISPAGNGRCVITLSAGETEVVAGGEADDLAEAINRHRADPIHP